MLNEAIGRLEDKILELEFQKLKKEHARQSVLVTTAPEQKTKSTGWQLRTTRLPGNKRRYELRTEVGWKALSSDKSTWPREIREAYEGFERIDKGRTIGNRIVQPTNHAAIV